MVDPVVEPGQVLVGGFRVVAEVARGATSVVYRGVGPAGEGIAIKVLTVEGAGRGVALARFVREAELAGRLALPDVCPVVGEGTLADGAPFLVQPWVEGESLASNRNRWELRPAAALVARLLRTLARLHAAGVTHRDLKPANLMRVGAGTPDEHLCLIDFGLAAATDQAPAARLTATGAFAGTPRYMAPEQVLGERTGPGTDVYQAALILVELLQGRPAAGGDSAYACMQAHADGRLDLDPGLRAGALGPWLAATLARDPAARPTAAEAAATLAAAASAHGEQRRRWWAPVALAGAVVLGAVAVRAGHPLGHALAAAGRAPAEVPSVAVPAHASKSTLFSITSAPGSTPVTAPPTEPAPTIEAVRAPESARRAVLRTPARQAAPVSEAPPARRPAGTAIEALRWRARREGPP